jgi:hypothetical protein
VIVFGFVLVPAPVRVLVFVLVLAVAPALVLEGVLAVVLARERVPAVMPEGVVVDDRECAPELGLVFELVLVLVLAAALVLVFGRVRAFSAVVMALSSSSGSSKENKGLHTGQGSSPATSVPQPAQGWVLGGDFLGGEGVPKTLARLLRPRVFFSFGWGGGVGGLL